MTTDEKNSKIESLKKTIAEAEKTIINARAMLLQLDGGASHRDSLMSSGDEEVVFGNFDGQIMIAENGKQYPVPANYASKSKLVEGDMLKLTISNGNFLYKQVGPTERKNLIGVAGQDENGNFFVICEGVPYKILLASITYFRIEPGDEVVITVPSNKDSVWAAVENVLQKRSSDAPTISAPIKETEEIQETPEISEEKEEEPVISEPAEEKPKDPMIDEWMSDIEEIKKEIQNEKTKTEA